MTDHLDPEIGLDVRTWVPDLFGEPSSPRLGSRGRRRYVPTRQRQAQVVELRRQGLSLAAIAAELGIGRNTLARHYASEVGSQSMLRVTLANGECQQHGSPMPCGRPTHKPTAETRAHVRRLVAESVKVAAIARALGIAPQTLAKHYPQELRPIG